MLGLGKTSSGACRRSRHSPVGGRHSLPNPIDMTGSFGKEFELGINNIFDASLATNFVYNFYNKISFKEIIAFIRNTCRILIRNKNYKVEHLPKIN